MEQRQPLKVASLFSGCGGLCYAFHKSPDFEVVYANDFDADACATYERNLGLKPECCDIATVEDIPDCDVILSGCPCQGASLANPARCEEDPRNGLYLQMIRLISIKQPKFFVFENVRGMMSLGGYETKADKKAQRGRVLKKIIGDFERAGYVPHCHLFKMVQYGVPQTRERVIILGVRKDLGYDVKMPSPLTTPPRTLTDAIGDLAHEEDPSTQHVGSKCKVRRTGYVGERDLYWDKPSPTLLGRGSRTGGPNAHIHPDYRRRMTIREYARIQTFPDDFWLEGSVCSMYRQLGNAVPPVFSGVLKDLIVSTLRVSLAVKSQQ